LFIAIDIGNTSTVIGAFEDDLPAKFLRIKTIRTQKENDLTRKLKSFFDDIKQGKRKIRGVGISSVVPVLDKIYIRISKKIFKCAPLVINSHMDLGISLRYDNPDSIGADRICNAVAGFAKYGGPLIIVDFGTATTYDVVGANGDYLGGVIAPGIETSAADLHRRAAKLPAVELKLPEKVIGTDTPSSMQIGILLGAVDAMSGMVSRIQAELINREGKRGIVVATGGFSSFIAQNSQIIEHVDANLVLDGIRLIFNKVKSK
jgi:type III pantothenate kinase